jgi:hypothetical protein
VQICRVLNNISPRCWQFYQFRMSHPWFYSGSVPCQQAFNWARPQLKLYRTPGGRTELVTLSHRNRAPHLRERQFREGRRKWGTTWLIFLKYSA